MLPDKFCYWLKGFAELHASEPDQAQWLKIKAELAKAKEISLDMPIGYMPVTMAPEQFCVWLSGFCELFGEAPDQSQWHSIKEHLNLVFTKVTSKAPGDLLKQLDEYKIKDIDIFTSPLIPFPENMPKWPNELSTKTAPVLIC